VTSGEDGLVERLAASVEELEKQRGLVLALNQMKNDLVAVLAHDIKGPLTSILGFAELLEEGYLEGEAATDAARTIRTNANRLTALANDVLTLSRVEYGELDLADERVDLVELLGKCISSIAKERRIELTGGVEKALVRGDRERLVQAFDNLLRNAVRYSPGGEPVSVEISKLGDAYVVSVSDHGIGIPPEEVAKLFSRFSRGTNARKAKIAGTGVGLFIVKTIVERHFGTIDVQSTLGEGSTFRVTLPSFESTAVAEPMRVTVVTPDAALARFIAYELRLQGYRVREAASIDAAASGDVRPGDVVLADAAIATPAQMRAAITARDVRLIGVGAVAAAGWDSVLPRPFLVTDLLAAVKR